MEILQILIAPEDIPLIRSIKPNRGYKADVYFWNHTKSSIYSVKTGYALVNQLNEDEGPQHILEPNITPLTSKAWTLKQQERSNTFLWQTFSGCVHVCNNLANRHCGTDRFCPRCRAEVEPINHLLFECPPKIQTLALSVIPTSPGSFSWESLYINFDYLLWRAKEDGTMENSLDTFPWIIWYIWKAKNDKAFNGKEISPIDTFQFAIHEAESWKIAQMVSQISEISEKHSCPPLGGESIGQRPRCQLEASWVGDDVTFGGGCVIELENRRQRFDTFAKEITLSPLHAEFNTLLCAMKTVLTLGESSMSFESDYLQMVKLIDEEEE